MTRRTIGSTLFFPKLALTNIFRWLYITAMQALIARTRLQWNGMILLVLFVVGVWLVPTLHLHDCDMVQEAVARCGGEGCCSHVAPDAEPPPGEEDEYPEHCPICRVKSLCLAVAATALRPCMSSIMTERVPAVAGCLPFDPPIHYFRARGPPVRA